MCQSKSRPKAISLNFICINYFEIEQQKSSDDSVVSLDSAMEFHFILFSIQV